VFLWSRHSELLSIWAVSSSLSPFLLFSLQSACLEAIAAATAAAVVDLKEEV